MSMVEPTLHLDNDWTRIKAGYDVVDDLVSHAGAYKGIAPLWNGWALREAFQRGIEWQLKQQKQ